MWAYEGDHVGQGAVTTEAAFTLARPDCPHPDRWHATDPYSTENEVTALVAALVTALQPDTVVETGTFVGNTAEAIGRALRANGHGHLTTLEVDRDLAEQAAQRCAGLPVTVLNVSSLQYEPPQLIDFAWFDCDAHRRQDAFRHLLPWMHSRTVVGFHDTGPQHPVRELLNPLVAGGLLVSPLFLPTPRGVCFARVEA